MIVAKWFMGIDPGITGAIAGIPEVAGGTPIFYDTPTIQIKVGKSLKSQMDVAQCKEILEQNREQLVCVFLEKVAPMPSTHAWDAGASMGVTSAFNFGKGVGIWIGLLTALEIPFEEVHPAAWKKTMMQGMGKEKGASILKATQLFPGATRELTRKRDHARADALLIAEYGRRLHQNPLREVQRPSLADMDLSLL